MKICHISDTHGLHNNLVIPECDMLIHSGDIGGKTNNFELAIFLDWFDKQPAKKKIFIPGNHDLICDKKEIKKYDSVMGIILKERMREAQRLISCYDITYLCNKSYVYEGLTFFGSPYSPSFHRSSWAFNADRGQEISKEWAKIPSNVDILITHTPPYNILDYVDERYKRFPDEDMHVGCKDLMDVIKKRLFNLKLHLFGHIHDQYGVQIKKVSQSRNVMFSNGAVLNNDYKILVTKPLIITI